MDRINVTKTFLPPYEEFEGYLRRIWQSSQLTNQGPLLQEFEAAMREYLGIEYFHFVSNGTMAIQLALHGLDVTEGEVITTPFSYVATTSAILWERCTPVFVDIEPDTFCIDPAKIEAAITDKTKAIMPVHVFGNACDIEAIQKIADKHNLKVIYDAAHAFGVTYEGESLLDYGDIAIGSFHATKLFHTIEGGCLVIKDKGVSDKVELLKRFGHNGDDHYMLGINAKSSEVQAAMGLTNLKYIDENIAKRRKVSELYSSLLMGQLQIPAVKDTENYNYAYYPVLFEDEARLLRTMEVLVSNDIFIRRYFYPSLNTLPYLQQSEPCPISEDISLRIACLPLYADLELEQVERICAIIKGVNG